MRRLRRLADLARVYAAMIVEAVREAVRDRD